jgi:hypothetical protein
MMRRTTAILTGVCLLCASAPAAPDTAATPSRTIAEAVQRFEAARGRVETELGREVAADFGRRLFDDLERQHVPAPEGYPPADWAETAPATSGLPGTSRT